MKIILANVSDEASAYVRLFKPKVILPIESDPDYADFQVEILDDTLVSEEPESEEPEEEDQTAQSIPDVMKTDVNDSRNVKL